MSASEDNGWLKLACVGMRRLLCVYQGSGGIVWKCLRYSVINLLVLPTQSLFCQSMIPTEPSGIYQPFVEDNSYVWKENLIPTQYHNSRLVMKISIDYTYFVPHNNNRKGLIFAQRGERNEGSVQNIKPSWYALSCRIQCFSHSHRQHAATRQRGHGGILHRHLANISLFPFDTCLCSLCGKENLVLRCRWEIFCCQDYTELELPVQQRLDWSYNPWGVVENDLLPLS